MGKRTKRYHKPDLMLLLTFFVGVGVLVTSVAQAEEVLDIRAGQHHSAEQPSTTQWLRSLWDLDLGQKIQNWKPKVKVDDRGHGLNLTRPLGIGGPALRVSMSVPGEVTRSLRAGGDHQIGASNADRPDAYIFLQKRW